MRFLACTDTMAAQAKRQELSMVSLEFPLEFPPVEFWFQEPEMELTGPVERGLIGLQQQRVVGTGLSGFEMGSSCIWEIQESRRLTWVRGFFPEMQLP